jgi:2-polyprenyl-3-methyl-5-hydroxy-6-metoxy-1,4-benzoquinol methylase
VNKLRVVVNFLLQRIRRQYVRIRGSLRDLTGRWSRQLAPLFVEFVGVRDGENVLDVGCGTGSAGRPPLLTLDHSEKGAFL